MNLNFIDEDLSKFKKQINKSESENENNIAVIGMSIKTSDAKNIKEFWNNIKNGIESIKRMPEARREFNEKYIRFLGKKDDEINFRIAGYMDDIDKFDYNFFKIIPKEAELMDPNQRLFLQSALEAIEDSGYGGKRLSGSKTGVYVGCGGTSEYFNIVSNIDKHMKDIAMTGNLTPVIASRLSYILNLKGPNMIIDTTCSSSLVAIHTAVQGIKNNDCDLAIAGGINISILPEDNNSNIGVISKSNKTKTFDNNADGTLLGEGVGVIVLKRLDKAIKDNDSIYGVIKASNLNQDGKSLGITAPNQKSQESLLIDSWKAAHINPEEINYIESHGTGTILGDPIEIEGIKKAFEHFTTKKQFCAIGSLKPNIGHTVYASGISGVIKVLLMMKYKCIPPLINFNIPNKNINFEDSPIYINNRLSKLEGKNGKIRCGISSFGLSGTNAHIILESIDTSKKLNNNLNEYNILALSAESKYSLNKLIDKYIEDFNEIRNNNVCDVCYTANTGRGHYKYRISIIFKDFDELYNKLQNIDSEDVFKGNFDFDKKNILPQKVKQLTTKVNKIIEEYQQKKINKYEKLKYIAQLYVEGAYVDWEKIYKNNKFNKVHLPVYQFMPLSCWVKVPEIVTNEKSDDNTEVKNDCFEIDKTVVLVGKDSGTYTESEKILGTLLKKLMGYKEINVNTNFNEFGGDSIILSKFYSELKKYINDIAISDIFSHPTICELGKFLDENFSEKDKLITEEVNYDNNSDTDIAIIGISAKLPKADSPEEFWHNLVVGDLCIDNLDKDREKICNDYLKYVNKYDKSVRYPKCGYMRNIDEFDYKFFNISPKEANLMDPHQRLFLQEAWKSIEDAGYTRERISGTNTGVYVGYTNDFRINYWRIIDDVDDKSFKMSVAPNLTSILPSRISYILNLKGPSLLVDTACSSSAVAIHLACRALQKGECSMAVAGGVRVEVLPEGDIEKGLGVEAKDFTLRAFDDNASGSVWGEGVISFLLKPLCKAEKDKDHIYAVIKGSAVNQDGTSVGITSPNPKAQTEVIKKCWDESGINPKDIDYIECHGTGTELGDPMEIEGLNNAFKNYTDNKQFCGIGSCKSNIGHLLQVSGAVSILKLIFCLQKRMIPANINFNVPNRKMELEKSSVYFVNKEMKWDKGSKAKLMATSSFGLSGTNCHIVLQEYISEEKESKDKVNLFVTSAKSLDSLWGLINEYNKYLRENSDINISNICYTAACRRNHYKYRIGILAENIQQLQVKIDNILSTGFNNFKKQMNSRPTLEISDESVKDLVHKYVNSGKRDFKVLSTLKNYYEANVNIRWDYMYCEDEYSVISIPRYFFEKTKCWVDIPKVSYEDGNNKIKKKFQVKNKVVLCGRDKDEYLELEEKLAIIWGDVLGLKNINVNDNFYELGGHSIAMMQIVEKINEELNLEVSYSEFNEKNTIEELAKILENKTQNMECSKYPQVVPDQISIYEQFPITDIQMSYLLGRKDLFEMGKISTCVYMELETELDIERLSKSLNKVIERHPMLRATFNDNGTQCICKKDREVEIYVEDISMLSDSEKQEYIIEQRNKISNNVLDVKRWPLIDIKALKINENKHYLFISFDMIISDGSSLTIIARDWMRYYNDLDSDLPKLEFTFRDYMVALEEFKKSKIYKDDKKYWQDKLDTFPKAPKLRYKVNPITIDRPDFSRLSKKFSNECWNRLKKVAHNLNVSPSALLCTVYAEVLSHWSNENRFAVNLTVFNRYPFNKDVDNIVGDFTSVMLIDINLLKEESFFERVKRIQDTIIEALEHRHYDGVELIRELAVKENRIGEPIMPIVFTSMLFDGEKNPWLELGKTMFGSSRTPQVYLDNQAGIIGDELLINWDYVNQIFDKGVIEKMFEQYIQILEYLMSLNE